MDRPQQALMSLDDDQRNLALVRFELLRPHLEEGRPLIEVWSGQKASFRTAQRWVAAYHAYGLCGLVRQGRSDRGRRRQISPEMQAVAEGLALRRPPWSIAAIERELRIFAEARGEPAPTYTVIYDVVRELSPSLVSLGREGSKRYRNRFDLVHRREADRPNEIWQADHTECDLWARRPDGVRDRPWLTLIVDDHSRAIAGFAFSFDSPSAFGTSLALRQAIWRKTEPAWPVFGVPEILYVDNGSDFTSHHLQQVAADLKIVVVNSTPGEPRGRGKIERLFETVNRMFLSTLPGYIGQGGVTTGSLLDVQELHRRFHVFLDLYHGRNHSETGQAPRERWTAHGFIPRMAESLEQLDLLLMTVAKSRRVQRDGIRFQGMRYLDPVLAAYVGETVTVRFDPRDLGEIRLFHDEKFLCRAICPELAGEAVSLREIVRARKQRLSGLRQELQDRSRAAKTLIALRGGESVVPVAAPEPPPTPVSRLKRYAND